jgi:hypothetical protein
MRHTILFLIVGFVVSSFFIANAYGLFEQGWQNVFCKIVVIGNPNIIECNNMKDTLNFEAGQGITIAVDKPNKKLTFGTVPANISMEQLSNVTDGGCAVGQIRQVNSAGMYVCADLPSGGSGEANTASNLGSGILQLFHSKSGIDLRFKSLNAGQGIALTNGTDTGLIATSFKINNVNTNCGATDRVSAISYNNSTGVTTITCSPSGEANTASNIGTGTLKLFHSKSGVDLKFKSLSAGTGIGLLNGTDTGTITTTFRINNISTTCSGTDKINSISYNNSTGVTTITCSTDQTGSGGETNTASNIGTGTLKLFHSKSGVDLRFKTLIAGQGITLTNGTDTGTVATNFKVNNVSTTCSGTDKISSIIYNNATGVMTITCSADQTGSGGESNTASNLGTGTLKLFHSKSGIDLRFKSLNAGQGIALTNGTDTGTVATNFKVNNVSTTCSGTDKISSIIYNNATGVMTITCSADQTGSGGGPTLLASDVTCTDTVSYCTIFTIPLTTSTNNVINAQISGSTNTAGVALQFRGRTTQATSGSCTFLTQTTATAQTIDTIATGTAPADTSETAWASAANIPQITAITCTVIGPATATNLILEYQMEVAGTGTVYKNSYYTKTP